MIALLATFFSLAYAASRQFYHLARAGELPRFLAVTNRRHAPWGALAVTAACGVFSAAFRPDAVMVVFIFLVSVSYLLVLGAFIKLRHGAPGRVRPYRAVGGTAMAVVGLLLALTVVASCYRLRPAALSRTGSLWALEQFQVRPDIVVIGKGLSGGLYPIAAAVLSQTAGSWLEENGWGHVSTFGGADVACRVAQRVLEICAEESNLEHARGLATHLRRGLDETVAAAKQLPRGRGIRLASGGE